MSEAPGRRGGAGVAVARPRCVRCGGPVDGARLLTCDACQARIDRADWRTEYLDLGALDRRAGAATEPFRVGPLGSIYVTIIKPDYFLGDLPYYEPGRWAGLDKTECGIHLPRQAAAARA